MGTWGTKPFDNDDAADFVLDVTSGDPSEVMESLLDEVEAVGQDYLEKDIGERAVACLAFLVVWHGGEGESAAIPGLDKGWFSKQRQKPSQALTSRAQRAAVRVLAPPSELLDLWEESEHAEEWKENVRRLLGPRMS